MREKTKRIAALVMAGIILLGTISTACLMFFS